MASSLWFVAETLPRAEARAQMQLHRQDFRCFLPRLRRSRRHARRVEQVLSPVFPGYVFVSFDPDRDPWRAINGTLGVKRLVGPAEGRPQPVPDDVMQALFGRCEGDLMVHAIDDLAPGQRVRLLSGPFAECIATIEAMDDKGRVAVLLEMLGKAMNLRVPAAALGPA